MAEMPSCKRLIPGLAGLARSVHYGVCARNFSAFTATLKMIDRLDENLRFYSTALNLRAHRQEVLASNIANADTPHYKARDLEFTSALSNAMSGKADGPLHMKQTAARHLPGEGGAPYGSDLKYRTEYQGSVDGNTVNMDTERAAFAENAMHFEALLTFVRSRFDGLRSAMQSQ